MPIHANASSGPGAQWTSDTSDTSRVVDSADSKVVSRREAMVAVLAVANFRKYVSGQALSLIGTWVETVAQGLLVLRLTHSGVLLGLTTAARYAPILLLSPYAGLVVDRFSKRRILLVTQFG